MPQRGKVQHPTGWVMLPRMAKPEYRLETLFGIRERKKKDAEDAYATAMKAKVAEEKKLAEMKEELKRMHKAREARRIEYADKAARGECNVRQIQGNATQIDRMKEKEGAYRMEIEKQKEAIKAAEAVVEEKKQALILATQDFKALEKHKEKWTAEVKREAMLKEEDQMDDLAQSTHLKRQREERGES